MEGGDHVPWNVISKEAPSPSVYVEPPPLKNGDVLLPHKPLYLMAGLVSSYVTFFTVALLKGQTQVSKQKKSKLLRVRQLALRVPIESLTECNPIGEHFR